MFDLQPNAADEMSLIDPKIGVKERLDLGDRAAQTVLTLLREREDEPNNNGAHDSD